MLLRSGSKEDEVDVNVKVDDSKPWRAILSLDDTGTSETGYLRSGIGFQHTNLTNRDDTLTAQYVTSPTNQSKVSIYGVGYRLPFYNLNSSLDLIAGHSDTDSGTVQGLFNVSGSGTIAGARYNYQLPAVGEVRAQDSRGAGLPRIPEQCDPDRCRRQSGAGHHCPSGQARLQRTVAYDRGRIRLQCRPFRQHPRRQRRQHDQDFKNSRNGATASYSISASARTTRMFFARNGSRGRYSTPSTATTRWFPANSSGTAAPIPCVV